MKKTILSIALAMILTAGVSANTHASLASNAILNIGPQTGFCAYDLGTYPDACIIQPVPDGNYFAVDTDGSGAIEDGERVGITAGTDGGILLGIDQARGAIDLPWIFFGLPGQHYTSDGDGLTVASASGNTAYIDMSGLNIWWGDSAAGTDGQITIYPYSNLSYASITCGLDCLTGDTFVLDYQALVACNGSTCTPYELHLEGIIGSVPIPAAVWLFGSGLIGLIGVARRKKA